MAIVDGLTDDDLRVLARAAAEAAAGGGRLGAGHRHPGAARPAARRARRAAAAGRRRARGGRRAAARRPPMRRWPPSWRPAARASPSTRCNWPRAATWRPRRWPGRGRGWAPRRCWSTPRPSRPRCARCSSSWAPKPAGALVEQALSRIALGLVRAGVRPAGGGRRRDLGRLRAGAGHHAAAHRPADRPRRALVPCGHAGARRPGCTWR